METTLTELLSTEFLHCPGCMRGCYVPRMLNCLHSFCDNCVRSGIIKVAIDNNNKDADKKCVTFAENISPGESSVNDAVNNSEVNSTENGAINGYGKESKSIVKSSNTLTKSSGIAVEPSVTYQKYIVCPLCKENTKLPTKNGIQGLPTNAFLNNLLQIKGYKFEDGKKCDYCKFDSKETHADEVCVECQDILCTECAAAHRRTKVTRSHQVVPFSEISKHSYDHDLRSAQRIQCSEHTSVEVEAFCEQCKVTVCSQCKEGKHYQHSVWEFKAIFKQNQAKSKQLLGTIDSKLPSIAAWIKFMQLYTEDVKKLQQKRLQELDKHTKNLHMVIEEHKIQQMLKIKELCERENNTTVGKIEQLMRAKQYLKHDSELLKNLLTFGKPDEILTMQKPILKRAGQLSSQQLDSLTSRLNIQFQPSSVGGESLEKLFGKLSINYLPVTQEELVSLGGNSISASIMLPNVLPKIEMVTSFDADCGTDSKDVWPSGVCLMPEGEYVVVDRDNRRVKIFDKSGGVQANFCGLRQNELGCPFDVAVLKDGCLAVSDYDSENIKIFKRSGEYVRDIRGFFKYPRGIAVTSKGHIVVVDCHFRRVTIHNPDNGDLLRTIEGKDENGCDYFTDPYYVTVTPDDKIVVTDWAAPNLRIFTLDGKHLNSYGSYGTRQDQVLHPYGVCSDSYGYIFIADNQNHRVHLLLPDGNFSRHLLNKMDNLWHPIALSADNCGNLIVTEALGKVKVFKYM